MEAGYDTGVLTFRQKSGYGLSGKSLIALFLNKFDSFRY
jgi:hypothetical protein